MHASAVLPAKSARIASNFYSVVRLLMDWFGTDFRFVMRKLQYVSKDVQQRVRDYNKWWELAFRRHLGEAQKLNGGIYASDDAKSNLSKLARTADPVRAGQDECNYWHESFIASFVSTCASCHRKVQLVARGICVCRSCHGHYEEKCRGRLCASESADTYCAGIEDPQRPGEAVCMLAGKHEDEYFDFQYMKFFRLNQKNLCVECRIAAGQTTTACPCSQQTTIISHSMPKTTLFYKDKPGHNQRAVSAHFEVSGCKSSICRACAEANKDPQGRCSQCVLFQISVHDCSSLDHHGRLPLEVVYRPMSVNKRLRQLQEEQVQRDGKRKMDEAPEGQPDAKR
jgi:hypothetical protein